MESTGLPLWPRLFYSYYLFYIIMSTSWKGGWGVFPFLLTSHYISISRGPLYSGHKPEMDLDDLDRNNEFRLAVDEALLLPVMCVV
ncbi:hypothetical protein BDW71DRAFT_129298 [Aspergillus fruticulosus]